MSRVLVLAGLMGALTACFKDVGFDSPPSGHESGYYAEDEVGCPGSVSGDTTAAGGQVFVEGAGEVEVSAVFNGGHADLSSALSLSAPRVVPIGTLHVTAEGTEVALGAFAPGEELWFTIVTPSGDTWSSGPASRNSDGRIHARVVQAADGVWYGGFEDLPNTGDSDYNDVCFSILGALRLQPPEG